MELDRFDDDRSYGARRSIQRGDVGHGPTAQRILLGVQLRQLRETAGVSREAAAGRIRATASKISRLELGRTSSKQRDIADLLTLYGVADPDERESLLALSRTASSPGWWQQYNDVIPSWLEQYVGLEEAAELIRSYEVQFIHGLLQTADYAHAVIMLRHTATPVEEVLRRVEMRMHRQRILHRSDPPRLWAVIDEAALRRMPGGPSVARGQLQHLLDLTDLKHITVQIIPFGAGAHSAAGGPFTLLRFPAPDLPELVYLEQLTSALYLDKPSDVDDYTKTMHQLIVEAATPDQTRDLLTSMLKEL